ELLAWPVSRLEARLLSSPIAVPEGEVGAMRPQLHALCLRLGLLFTVAGVVATSCGKESTGPSTDVTGVWSGSGSDNPGSPGTGGTFVLVLSQSGRTVTGTLVA